MRLLRDGGGTGLWRRFGMSSLAGAVCLVAASAAGAAAQAPADAVGAADVRAMLDRYCVACHNDRLRTAELSLAGVDAEHPEADPDLWERVVAKLRAASMPPPRRPRPDPATYTAVAAHLEGALDAAWFADPYPGRGSAVHRIQPDRVRQRRPRPLRPRHRRLRSAAGGRDGRRQLRQLRRRSHHLARPSRALPVGGAAGSPASRSGCRPPRPASTPSRCPCTSSRTAGRARTCPSARAAASRSPTSSPSTASTSSGCGCAASTRPT